MDGWMRSWRAELRDSLSASHTPLHSTPLHSTPLPIVASTCNCPLGSHKAPLFLAAYLLPLHRLQSFSSVREERGCLLQASLSLSRLCL